MYMLKFHNLILMLFILLFIMSIYNSVNLFQTKESFTPKIREMYRPYVRNTRIIYENTFDHSLYRINRFFRNVGMI